MKVTALIGSARKKYTYDATVKLLEEMQNYGSVEYEILMLSDYNLKVCKGCKLCLDKGEELCPLKDDRDILINKISESDGLILVSPNYSFHVSGQMKIFLDRLGYIFHRPQFFGKAFSSIVAQGVYGGKDIIKYFNFIGKALGFNVVSGTCIRTLEPLSQELERKNDKKIMKLSKNFYSQLVKNELPKPSIFELMIFRMSRSTMKIKLDESFRDYNYYKEKGWFKSDFYYDVSLNPFKKILGIFFDFISGKMAVK